MAKFKIGITRDVLDKQGEPSFGRAVLKLLDDDPAVEYEFLPEVVKEVQPAHLAAYDALYVNVPLVTRASFPASGLRTHIIARHGVGYDSVDIPACTEHDVIVTIQPDGVRRPVAVAAITYVLALAQKLLIKHRITGSGRWSDRLDHMGMGVTGRTLGVVGAGSIGREILKLAKPFDMNLLASDPYVDSEMVTAAGARLVDLDTLMRESDFVVVICLLTEQTRHLIDARRIGLMKPTAYLINVARGPIVDEKALIAGLEEGRIAGAGLDVFEQEPVDPANPLLAMENVIVTPHALCWTDECFGGLAASGFKSLLAALHGQTPNNVVDRAVLERPGLKDWMAANAAHRTE